MHPLCAHRTITASPWRVREQGGPSLASLIFLSQAAEDKNKEGDGYALTVRVQ